MASSVLSEFENAHEKLNEQLRTLQKSSAGTNDALELFGPDASEKNVEEFRVALQKSLSVGSFSHRYNSLNTLQSLKGDIDFIPEQTWKVFQSWKTIMSVLDVDSKHLERNREEHFLNTLIRLDVSVLQLIQISKTNQNTSNEFINSKFSSNLSAILRDPGAESVLAMRGLRLSILIDTYQEAISISDYIINSLRDSIAES